MRAVLIASWTLAFWMGAATVRAESPEPAGSGPVQFVMHRVGSYRGEPCGVGDFDGDGKLDIVAGPYLYLAPDWKAHEIRKIQGEVDDQGKGYRYDFMNLPLDVDGDGRLDVVSCSWHEKKTSWFRNVGTGGGLWPETVVEVNGNFECGDLWDINGDGKALEVLPHTRRTVWYELGKLPDGSRGLVVHVVSENELEFGGGVGDVNGDGRPDILRPNAWYEAPADPRSGKWKEHPLAVGSLEQGKAEHTPQILVYDVNADGLADIITSSAHRYGVFWYEQVREEKTLGGESPMVVVDFLEVLEVARDLCTISGGSDDGLRPGHVLEVYRVSGTESTHVARIRVVKVVPDQAVCKVEPDSRNREIRRGDRISSRLGDETASQAAPALKWKQRLIDKSWSQAHSLTLADLDADGDLDLVTGKRFMAHNGGDPGALDPPGLFWYELQRGPTPAWKKHVISYGEGIGAGMNIPVVDLDGDGDLDIVVTGKWGGPVWFENRAK